MTIKVGINGKGRIGRMIVRSIIENKNKNIEIKYINNRTNSETCSSLLKYDSIHGKFNAQIDFDENHIIINKTCMEDGELIPVDNQHRHYGGGQKEAQLDLEPGNYSLTLQFANGMHQSYGEMCKTISVTVR